MPERSITNVAGIGRSQLPSAVWVERSLWKTSRCRSFRSAGDGELHPVGGDDLLVDVAQHVEGESVLLGAREAGSGAWGLIAMSDAP